MSAQIILIACLLLLLTSLIILGLCVLNWRLYVALYQGNDLSSVWCFGRHSSSEERTAVVDRNPAVENNQMMNRECSMHLEQIDKLKRWHLSQLSSAQSTVRKDEMSATTIDPVNNKESTKVFIPSVGETNNNIYEDISTTEIEMHQLKSDSNNDRLVQSANLKLEHDPARSDYTTLSDDYLDQSSIHSVRVNIPAASSPVNHHIRQHLAQNKRSWKLSPEPHHHHDTYEQFESTGVSCIYFHPEPDYEDSGLPETSLARGTLEKKAKEIP